MTARSSKPKQQEAEQTDDAWNARAGDVVRLHNGDIALAVGEYEIVRLGPVERHEVPVSLLSDEQSESPEPTTPAE